MLVPWTEEDQERLKLTGFKINLLEHRWNGSIHKDQTYHRKELKHEVHLGGLTLVSSLLRSGPRGSSRSRESMFGFWNENWLKASRYSNTFVTLYASLAKKIKTEKAAFYGYLQSTKTEVPTSEELLFLDGWNDQVGTCSYS